MRKQRRPRLAAKQAPVSLGGIEIEEALPYPLVYYPNHYGTFFAFAQDKQSKPFLCACVRPALENLARLNIQDCPDRNANPLRMAPLDSLHVPDVIARLSLRDPTDPISGFEFENRLCHRCNLIPPTRRWCHEMYGGRFKQSFGWYIQEAYLRVGIRPFDLRYLPDVCPDDFQECIDELHEASETYNREYERVMKIVQGPPRLDIARDEVTYWQNLRQDEAEPMLALKKGRDRVEQKLRNAIESITREEFGFRKVGKAWVSETLLYQIVERIFAGQEVAHHHRPDWLDGLELDIFIPKLQIGVEYQGQQHFHPIEAWGGVTALRALQIRDQLKRTKCVAAGVRLIEIDYSEPLTEGHIRQRLVEAGINRKAIAPKTKTSGRLTSR